MASSHLLQFRIFHNITLLLGFISFMLLNEHPPEHFPHHRFGEIITEFNEAGDLVRSSFFAAGGYYFIGTAGLPLPQPHPGFNRLTAIGVGNTATAYLSHGWYGRYNLFHLARPYGI